VNVKHSQFSASGSGRLSGWRAALLRVRHDVAISVNTAALRPGLFVLPGAAACTGGGRLPSFWSLTGGPCRMDFNSRRPGIFGTT